MSRFVALEERIEEQMRAGHVPGLALAIVRHLEVVYSRGFGVTSVEDGGLPVTPHTLFRVGSITKSMTATAIMRLVEAGHLDLDRPASEYVPWLTFSDPGAAGRITLRMLLSHTAGLPTSHTPFGRREPRGLEAYVRHDVPLYPFVAPPGKLYAYSNPGVRIAGYVAEVVSGRPYARLMQEMVFDPLDMRRTTFDPTVAMTYPLAQSHGLEDGVLRVQHRYADDTGGYPSGAAISTAMDLCHYAIMHMSHGRFGERQVLTPESVAEMQRIQVDQYTTSAAGYGLALVVDTYKGQRRVSHDGSISTFGSKLAMVPDAGAAVVLLFNRAPGFWAQAQALVDGILDELLCLPSEAPLPRAVEPDRALWPRYTGTYLGDWRGLAVVEAVDAQLRLTWNGEELPLTPVRQDLCFARRPDKGDVVSVGFIAEGSEPVQYIQVNSSPCRRARLDSGWAPAPTAWRACVGQFTGVENFAFRLQGDRLLAYSEDEGREMPCVPLSNTRFACDVGLIEFQGTGGGPAPSLRLGNVYTLQRKADRSAEVSR